jgi:hypothetical protein
VPDGRNYLFFFILPAVLSIWDYSMLPLSVSWDLFTFDKGGVLIGLGLFGLMPGIAIGAFQNWNGHPYLVQEEWSKAISACTQGHTSVTPTPTPTTPTATVTPTPIPGMACQVTYMVQSQWPGGFTASITIANTSSTSINGWTLIFTFPGSQQVTQGWNGTFSQAGSQVTVKNLSYNAAIAAAGSVCLGFNGSWTGSNPNPTSFTLNGSSCSTA